MLRQYAQYNPVHASIIGQTKQKHHQRLAFGAALDWCLDFEKALNCLDDRDRALLILAHGAGYDFSEIRRITGVNTRTIPLRLAAAEERLRDAIEAQEQPRARNGNRWPRYCRPGFINLRGVIG